jgi:hypothetical protein
MVIWAAWNDGVDTSAYTYGTTATGFHIPNGNNESIRQWSGCKNVAPSGCGSTGLFVPTKTQTEWYEFISNAPACANVTTIPCY